MFLILSRTFCPFCFVCSFSFKPVLPEIKLNHNKESKPTISKNNEPSVKNPLNLTPGVKNPLNLTPGRNQVFSHSEKSNTQFRSTHKNMTQNEILLNVCAKLKDAAMNPNIAIRNEATDYLQKAQFQVGWMKCLMLIISSNEQPQNRLLAAITLKNFVKSYWEPSVMKGRFIIPDDEKVIIRKEGVGLLFSVPDGAIRKMMIEMISLVAEQDFPDRWVTLIPQLCEKLNGGFENIRLVLQTIHSISESYRDKILEPGNDLENELVYVIKNWFPAMTKLFPALLHQAQREPDKKIYFECIYYITEIYYSLTYLELPDDVIPHLEEFFGPFLQLLESNSPLDKEDSSDTPGIFTKIKTVICNIGALFIEKYLEYFEKYIQMFTHNCLKLLSHPFLPLEVRNDLLGSTALHFLTKISKSSDYCKIFNPSLPQLCDLIIANIQLTDRDVETFSDSPEEYVVRDIEGSDYGTRRRAAAALIKGLRENFETDVTRILQDKIARYSVQYFQDKSSKWKDQDISFVLFTSLAVETKRRYTGVSSLNKYVNLDEFFQKSVLPEFQTQSGHPILKADALKFICTFRNQLPKSMFPGLLPFIVSALSREEYVLHTYAAWCLERTLLINDNNRPRFGKDDLRKDLSTILNALFSALNFPDSSENQYIMKAIFRVVVVSQDYIEPLKDVLISSLSNLLALVSKNPSNPEFNHFIFETLAAIVQFNPKLIHELEAKIVPICQSILQNKVEEFISYVFQLLGVMLHRRPSGELSQDYQNLYQFVVSEKNLWEEKANIPALVFLLKGFTLRAPQLFQGQRLNHVLNVYSHLISSKTHDHSGFDLINSVVENLPMEMWQNVFSNILKLMFNRLQSSKTPKFVRLLVIFLSVFTIKCGLHPLVKCINDIQPNLFLSVAKIWYENMNEVQGSQRKLVSAAVTKVLCQLPEMSNSQEMLSLWDQFFIHQIRFVEVPSEEKSVFVTSRSVDGPEFTVKFKKLSISSVGKNDNITKNLPNPKVYFAQGLASVFENKDILQHAGNLFRSNPNFGICVKNYFQAAGIKTNF